MRLLPIILCFLTVLTPAVRAATTDELRGGWVTAWNKGLFTQSEADATIAAAKQAGLNALFVQVRKVGDAYYESSMEPRGDNIAPGFDPLAYMVRRGHASGIQIHAWVNVCRIWRVKEPPADPAHMVNRHPEWLNKDYNGNSHASDGMFMDPGVPEAREYVASLIADIAKRYDVDGIHLDYIRYPGKQWGYSSAALACYRENTGISRKPKPDDQKWLCWRTARVTDMLKLIRERVHAVRSRAVISAATIAWGDCRPTFGANLTCQLTCQNWDNWLDTGLLDANVPMNYRSENSGKSAAQFRIWLKGFKRWNGGRPTYVGLDVHNNNPSGIVRQISAVRSAGLQGYVLFSFNESTLRDSVVAALARQSPSERYDSFTNLASRQMFDKGVRYAAANQLGLAEVHLKKAVELDPDFADAHFRLGRVYLREHKLARARECFETALTIDPSHAYAKAELDAMESAVR
ncbi:MAG: glycoside hydrolase family 10 protein [Armatimonadota bacterium]